MYLSTNKVDNGEVPDIRAPGHQARHGARRRSQGGGSPVWVDSQGTMQATRFGRNPRGLAGNRWPVNPGDRARSAVRQCLVPAREGFTTAGSSHASPAASGPRARGFHRARNVGMSWSAVGPPRARASRSTTSLNRSRLGRAPAREGFTVTPRYCGTALTSGPRAAREGFTEPG